MDIFTYVMLGLLFGSLLCAAYTKEQRPNVEGVYLP